MDESKDFANGANGYHNQEPSHHEVLERMKTSQSIMMSPEMFEKLYLQPKPNIKGDLVRTFGNPTPLAITGFVVGLTPLSMILMEWRGSGELGVAIVGAFWFIAGPALWLGAILEFFLGNTFSFVVFFVFGGVFFGWATELTPRFSAGDAYAPNQNFFVGELEPGFASSLAFWIMVMGILSFIFMICALRINVVFFLVFLTASLGFLLLAGSFFQKANGNIVTGTRLQKGCGGSWFVTSLLGWYLIVVQLFDSVGFTYPLPVGDFSGFWARRAGKKPAEPSDAQAV